MVCTLSGPIDLRTLPAKLVKLDLTGNAFSGTVYLTAIPANMRVVCLSSNTIAKVVVCNDALPRSLESACSFHARRKPRFMCLGAEKLDRRVGKKITTRSIL